MRDQALRQPEYHFSRRERHGSPDESGEIGIALSGGGVRAACLGLGALQRAEDLGVFTRASFLSAVSGGSYIATAFVAARSTGDGEETRPWQRGSREEAHLRRNLRYLAEDWADQCLALASYVVRTAVHLLQFAAVLVVVGSSLGLLYRTFGTLTAEGPLLEAGHSTERYVCAVLLLVLGAMIDRGTRSPRADPWLDRLYVERRHLRRLVMALVAVLVVPDLVAVGTNLFNARKLDISAARGPVLAFLVGAVLIGAVVLGTQGFFPRSRLLKVAGMALRAVFSLAVLTIFVLPPLAIVSQQASQQQSTAALALVTSAAFLLFCGTFVHANSTSLHSTYARRLSRAYIIREAPWSCGPADPGQRRGDPPPASPQRLESIHLSDLPREGVPDLLLCAAVNVGADESAQGEGCTSFVFSSDYCGFPAQDVNFRDAVAKRSCAELVAASGAAIAPNMGRLTRKSARALLALLNLRLGLWIQAPAPRDNETTRLGSAKDRIAQALPPYIVEGWREPGPLWTWREAFGAVSKDYECLFISDGGHWDNSGIIELMRRRCQTIFAVDAAVDDMRLSNLLRAMSLARTELGVEVMADSQLLASHSPVLRLRFSYPDEDMDPPKNQLIVMRTHIDPAMPADVVALSTRSGAGAGTGVFPRHVTLNQFLLARDVDAYITLGRWLFDRAFEEADLFPVATDHP